LLDIVTHTSNLGVVLGVPPLFMQLSSSIGLMALSPVDAGTTWPCDVMTTAYF
jgi:hypothetical protein